MSSQRRDVVICLDSFKGSIGSYQASEAAAIALREARPDLTFISIPFADGGEGTVDALIASGWRRLVFTVSSAVGSLTEASMACRGEKAVIELAQVAGLPQSPCTSEAALHGSTRGVGELIVHALNAGYREITLALGGSSTSDGGAGMLSALGARFMSPEGEIKPGAFGLRALTSVDLRGMDPRVSDVRFICATDVDNPMLGNSGSARVFGPQKGADQVDIVKIEFALSKLVQVTDSFDIAAVPGSGAAGGTAFGAMLALDAKVVSGADLVASATGLSDRAVLSRAVIVGEGRLDHQTLAGKGPAYLAQLAASADVPSFAIAGQVNLNTDELRSIGIEHAVSLSKLAPSVDEAIRNPAFYIQQAARTLAPVLP